MSLTRRGSCLSFHQVAQEMVAGPGSVFAVLEKTESVRASEGLGAGGGGEWEGEMHSR